MYLRENNFVLEVEEGTFQPFEEKVLTSGLCDFSLPMRFKKNRSIRTVTYECSGYTSVGEIQFKNIREVLEILEKTFITFNKAKEFLVNQNLIKLSMDTVFYNMKYKDVKIAYIPMGGELWAGENMMNFAMELKDRISMEGRDYIERVAKEIEIKNLNIEDAINCVGEIRREVYEHGIGSC